MPPAVARGDDQARCWPRRTQDPVGQWLIGSGQLPGAEDRDSEGELWINNLELGINTLYDTG